MTQSTSTLTDPLLASRNGAAPTAGAVDISSSDSAKVMEGEENKASTTAPPAPSSIPYSPPSQDASSQSSTSASLFGIPLAFPFTASSAPSENDQKEEGVGKNAESSYQKSNAGSSFPNPEYVHTTPVPENKNPFESFFSSVQEATQQTSDYASNLWSHVGKITQMGNLSSLSAAETLWRTHFSEFLPVAALSENDKNNADVDSLTRYFVCSLSTSAGPLAGTLFLSRSMVAFLSDNTLPYNPTPDEVKHSYYKVILPLKKIAHVQHSFNQFNPSEKFIQIITVDNFSFWFLHFLSYEDALVHLQIASITEGAFSTVLR